MEAKEQSLRIELQDLQSKLLDPAIFSSKEYPKLARRQSELTDIVALFDELKTVQDQERQAQEMVEAGGEMSGIATEELEELSTKLLTIQQALTEALTLKDTNDDKDVVM